MKDVHHTGITVSNFDRSIDFYHGVLGLEFDNEPSPIFDDEDLGPTVGDPRAALKEVTLKVADARVELLEYVAPASPNDTRLPQNAVGAQHVAFLVDDREAKVKALEAKGIKFFATTTYSDEGMLAGWRWVYFSNPGGITLELVEVGYTRPDERRRGVAAYLAKRQGRNAAVGG